MKPDSRSHENWSELNERQSFQVHFHGTWYTQKETEVGGELGLRVVVREAINAFYKTKFVLYILYLALHKDRLISDNPNQTVTPWMHGLHVNRKEYLWTPPLYVYGDAED